MIRTCPVYSVYPVCPVESPRPPFYKRGMEGDFFFAVGC